LIGLKPLGIRELVLIPKTFIISFLEKTQLLDEERSKWRARGGGVFINNLIFIGKMN
jgi:hypothetical protein